MRCIEAEVSDAANSPIRIEGLRELDLAFKSYGNGLEKGVSEVLAAAADPVRFEAEVLAVASIRENRHSLVSYASWRYAPDGIRRTCAAW